MLVIEMVGITFPLRLQQILEYASRASIITWANAQPMKKPGAGQAFSNFASSNYSSASTMVSTTSAMESLSGKG